MDILHFLKECVVLESTEIENAAFILDYKIDENLLKELTTLASSDSLESTLQEVKASFEKRYSNYTKSELAVIGDRIEHRGKESGMAPWMQKMCNILDQYKSYGHMRYKFLDALSKYIQTYEKNNISIRVIS